MFHLALLLAATVGYTHVGVPDGTSVIDAAVWYPTSAPVRATSVGPFTQVVTPDGPVLGANVPLIVISHGSGGDYSNHADTAYALAQAGFIVAAPTHVGDNWRDESRALDVLDRAAQLHLVVDYLVTNWHAGVVDARRVGVFGFSAGGFTALVAAGGEPDLAAIGPHCAAHPHYFDCQLVATHQAPTVAAAVVHDARIRALVVAAPALGFTFTSEGLKGVTVPVQLWRAQDDHVLPAPDYADVVARALPQPPETHVVPHADHFDFIAPCPAAFATAFPIICSSEADFDRVAFHQQFDAAVVAFFQHALMK